MKNWFDPDDRAALLARLDRLTSAMGPPRWGRMRVDQVVCHLADPLRVALKEKRTERLRTPLGLPGLSHAVVWLLPWPKGAPTAPEFLPDAGMTAPTEFERDKEALVELLRRFTEVSEQETLGPSPVFGALSRRSWGRLMWRHLDHHLRQFGL